MAETEKKEKKEIVHKLQRVESKDVLKEVHLLKEARVAASNVRDVQRGLVSASGVQQTRKEIEHAKSQAKEKTTNK